MRNDDDDDIVENDDNDDDTDVHNSDKGDDNNDVVNMMMSLWSIANLVDSLDLSLQYQHYFALSRDLHQHRHPRYKQYLAVHRDW